MDTRDLRYFETIAELQHLGRASARLHRTQPALTSSIRRLEASCGATLFEKSGRGIRLTEAGAVLLKWARQMRFDAEDAKRELNAMGEGRGGHVRIGIVPTAAQFLLPSAAGQFLRDAPDVTLRTVVGLVDQLHPMLLSGELDLVVGTEIAKREGLASRLLAEDSIVVAAHADHEVFQRTVTMRDLGQYRWALQPPGAPTRDWLDHVFDRRGLPRPHVQVETTMLLMLPALIVETGLLSFISRKHLEGKAAGIGLKEVPVRGAAMRRRLVVMHRAGAFLPPAARRLLEVFVRTNGSTSSPSPARSRRVGGRTGPR